MGYPSLAGRGAVGVDPYIFIYLYRCVGIAIAQL